MKLAFRTLLVIAICAMCYICVTSITVPIEFEQEQPRFGTRESCSRYRGENCGKRKISRKT